MFETIINVIENCNLLENVRKTGEILKCGLSDIEGDYYDLIHSTRGRGTYLAFNAQCPGLRNDMLIRLKKKGN
ncbi:hypothetical protein NQ314_008757 [Rhamnusium bicolor]|uniref:Uncharacterized protein n=1 Tax=Rhamnusium bicolor TaxID=1586634 RepID=A0AAV8Y6D5_9CUCU|nr:hypothetical protein NQ314_008757 [Rhamnusium bicolor]